MKNRSPIGIDIHRDGVRALQLITKGRRPVVKGVTHLPLEKPLGGSLEDLNVLGPLIRALVRQRIFEGKQAVVALPHEYLSAFPVTIERPPEQSFETVLARACAKHLSFPLEQAVLDYFCVEKISAESHPKLRVTVVAVRREQILKVIGTFKKAGLKVNIIDYGLCALMRSHTHIQALADAPSVLMHMDNASTLLAVASKTKIVAHRQLDWGMDRLRDRIAEALGLDKEGQQPQSMLSDYGVDYDALQDPHGERARKSIPSTADQISALRVVSQILVPNMEELVRELFQIIGYARSLSPDIQFQELCLYGMANEIKNLGPFLEKRLHIPTHQMNPFENVALHDMGGFEPAALNSYVCALGLALREAA